MARPKAQRVSTQLIFPAPPDHARFAVLCGPLDSNLHYIGATLGLMLWHHAQGVMAKGAPELLSRAEHGLRYLYERGGDDITEEDIQHALSPHLGDPSERIEHGTRRHSHRSKELGSNISPNPILMSLRQPLAGRTPNQQQYLYSIQMHDVVFGLGPAGTGKTYLAVASAIDALERGLVQRIILVRPAVEAGEHLGFLPGDLSQKISPYLRPLYDSLYDLAGTQRVERLVARNVIELAPLAYMRGRTLNQSFIILDEAQNTTPEQMKMFLTRIGFGSRVLITGDPSQIDLPRGMPSGLVEAQNILQGIEGIAFVSFDKSDVLRHPLVGRIIAAYEEATANKKDHTSAKKRGLLKK